MIVEHDGSRWLYTVVESDAAVTDGVDIHYDYSHDLEAFIFDAIRPVFEKWVPKMTLPDGAIANAYELIAPYPPDMAHDVGHGVSSKEEAIRQGKLATATPAIVVDIVRRAPGSMSREPFTQYQKEYDFLYRGEGRPFTDIAAEYLIYGQYYDNEVALICTAPSVNQLWELSRWTELLMQHNKPAYRELRFDKIVYWGRQAARTEYVRPGVYAKEIRYYIRTEARLYVRKTAIRSVQLFARLGLPRPRVTARDQRSE